MSLSDIFRFNKNDRLVAIWLFAIAACIVGFIAFGNSSSNDEELAAATVKEKTDSSNTYKEKGNHYYKDKETNEYRSNGEAADKSALHPFDLNIISPDEMMELGFNETHIRSILKYRSMGGIYRHKEQLSKIAGMTKGDYDRLAPYFYVSDDFLPASDFVTVPQNKRRSYPKKNSGGYGSGRSYGSSNSGNGKYSENKSRVNASQGTNSDASSSTASSPTPPRYVSNKIQAGETIPLNASDTTALKRVPGIGSTYAKMIVKYREKLGGFYAVEQLNDLQAIPAEVQEYFSLDRTTLRKLKINSLPINRLVSHPYMSFYQAQAIKDYIRKNGPIKSLSVLRLNKNFTDAEINRLEPYMDYE